MVIISSSLIYILIFISLYFEVFLLFTFWESRKQIKKEEAVDIRENYPTVSIMVPCYNEENTIRGTILSLLSLDYPKDKLKILIIDDGSIDSTLDVIQKFEENQQIDILKKENGGKHTALNYGLKYIDSEFVGCLDADSFVESSALKKIIKYFDDPETMVVTPAIKVYKAKNLIELIQNMEYKVGIFIRKMFGLIGALNVTPGPFSIFRRRVFDEIGDYSHGHTTEDMEMAFRMQSHHYKIENCHNAYVYTVAPSTLKDLHKQRVRWTYGFIKNAIDYRFMLFKKKYGNLGIFILPVAVLSIFSALYFTGSLAFSLISYFVNKVVEISVVGFNFNLSAISFDWFFIGTNKIMFLGYLMFVIAFAFILTGNKMVEGKLKLSLDLFCYLFLYGFLAPLWLAKALYNVFFFKEPVWK